MTQEKPLALISVTNKEGVADFALGLVKLGYEVLSTGGTAKLLVENDIPVTEVAEYTGSPEILDGRVKTLHPKVHGGILFDRSNLSHQQQAQEQGIRAISIVAVNLYQFQKKAAEAELSLDKAIEFIDIGGPTMLRAAAKNWQHVMSVIDPSDYPKVLEKLSNDAVDDSFRKHLSLKTFASTASYDAAISNYFADALHTHIPVVATSDERSLRYGENPHQKASFLTAGAQRSGFAAIEILQGKELSYNNYLDLDHACRVVRSFEGHKAVSIIKHTNPCGTAISDNDSLAAVYKKALAGDPKSAFGGIVATNQDIDGESASLMSSLFLECIAAPNFSPEAREIFSKKSNLRLLVAPWLKDPFRKGSIEWRSVEGGLLMQETDDIFEDPLQWETVTEKAPSETEMADLLFSIKVCAHVKSNAIVLAMEQQTLTVGAGQMSRIDAAQFAIDKALSEGKPLKGAVLASDAFFPFKDVVELAAKHGISAIVQPGGSKRDQESIDAANAAGISMVFTGKRHFKH